MNIQNLTAFCKLAELEHYGKASDELGIAQPSLSRIIRRMEEELAVELFQQSGRNIKLTKIGHIYYEKVRNGLSEIQLGAETVKEMVDPYYGTIDLGFIFTLGPETIPEILKQFRSRPNCENYKFKFWQGNTPRLIQQAKKGTCDFSICSFMNNEPEMEFTHLLNQPLVAIVSKNHPLAQKNSVTLKELSQQEMIFCLDKTQFIENLFRKENLPLNVACRVEEDQALAGLVSINFGAAILPYNQLLHFHDIKILRLEPGYQRPVYLAKRKDNQLTAGARVFEEFLKEKQFTLDLKISI